MLIYLKILRQLIIKTTKSKFKITLIKTIYYYKKKKKNYKMLKNKVKLKQEGEFNHINKKIKLIIWNIKKNIFFFEI